MEQGSPSRRRIRQFAPTAGSASPDGRSPSPTPAASASPPRLASRGLSLSRAWLESTVSRNPSLVAFAKLFTQSSKCTLCQNEAAQSPFVTMTNCEHKFHFSCLYTYFDTQVAAPGPGPGPRKPHCPVCATPGARPDMPNVAAPLQRPQNFQSTQQTLEESHVWAWIHYDLRVERDKEARSLSSRPINFQLYADITRQELAPLSRETNYFEMVNSCWVCEQLMGNEHWVVLDCEHAFHTFCVVSKFSALDDASDGWMSAYPCPLCEDLSQFRDTNFEKPLTHRLGNNLKQMAIGGLWYCMQLRGRPQDVPPSPPPPPPQPMLGSSSSPRGVKRSSPDEDQDDASTAPSRNVRQHSMW